MIMLSSLFSLSTKPVIAQQRVLEMEIRMAPMKHEGNVLVLRQGNHWAIKFGNNAQESIHWGYDGRVMVGLETIPEINRSTGKILPGIEPFAANEIIHCAWIAYCSQEYFKIPESERTMLDIPWSRGDELLTSSYDSSNLTFDVNQYFPKEIMWMWDSGLRKKLKNLRPFDNALRISSNESQMDGAVVGKFETLETKQVDKNTTVPKKFRFTRYRNPTQPTHSRNDKQKTASLITGELIQAHWRKIKPDETFLPDLPKEVSIDDYRFSDAIYFRLKHRYTLYIPEKWPSINNLFVRSRLLQSKNWHDQNYLKPPAIRLPILV